MKFYCQIIFNLIFRIGTYNVNILRGLPLATIILIVTGATFLKRKSLTFTLATFAREIYFKMDISEILCKHNIKKSPSIIQLTNSDNRKLE